MKKDRSKKLLDYQQSDQARSSVSDREAQASTPVKLGPAAKKKRISPTMEMMHAIAAERGGHCRSSNYVNYRTDLDWECAQGHRWKAKFSYIRQGTWCRTCFYAGRRDSLTDIQAVAESHGGRCLSDQYVNSRTLLWFECQQGHTWQAKPANIKLGHWCARCRQGEKRSTLERMREIAASRGGKCLSDTYLNRDADLRWACERGHEWTTTPSKIISQTWCPHCVYEKKRLGIDLMHVIAAERGGRCLSESYVNNHTHLTWQCDRDHVWQAVPSAVKNGQWCRQCYLDHITNPARKQQRKRQSVGLRIKPR